MHKDDKLDYARLKKQIADKEGPRNTADDLLTHHKADVLPMEDTHELLPEGNDHFARKIGMSSPALQEVLDSIEHKHTFDYIRETLRTQYATTLTNDQWAAIKEYAAKLNP